MSSATTRQCPDCKEWYDARSDHCYLCGEGQREINNAIVKAAEASRLNGALATQASAVRAQSAQEDAMLASKAPGTRGGAMAPPKRLPGFKDTVEQIKNEMEDHPEILDYFLPDTLKNR